MGVSPMMMTNLARGYDGRSAWLAAISHLRLLSSSTRSLRFGVDDQVNIRRALASGAIVPGSHRSRAACRGRLPAVDGRRPRGKPYLGTWSDKAARPAAV